MTFLLVLYGNKRKKKMENLYLNESKDVIKIFL
jgi:hypothetical protein